jgi:restriction endonuclease Mrr
MKILCPLESAVKESREDLRGATAKDIYAAKSGKLGRFLYIVECKNCSPQNHVGVGLIRNLYGEVQAERAKAGILVASSPFSRPAIDFQEKIQDQVSLQDNLGVQNWCGTQ